MAEMAVVFDIQRFSLHDGPGIRTTVFFKGCRLACAWCQNPEALDPEPQMSFARDRCLDCGQCAAACPQGAVVAGDEQRIDFSRCDGCGRCADLCDTNALARIGRRWHLDALETELLSDEDFYRESGGGVTLSGGEPLLQLDATVGLLRRLKRRGLHLNLETAGAVAWSRLATVTPWLDSVYFDLKHMDSAAHKRLTGSGNGRILDNFTRLAARFEGLQARMPVVPGLNDDDDNIVATARFLKSRWQTSIHCLPYHRLGEAKLARIHSRLRPLKLDTPLAGRLAHIERLFLKEGIHADIYTF